MKRLKFEGFTLTEVIAVLVVLGVLSVFFVLKPGDPGVNDIVDAGVIKNALRQTIMRAMSDLQSEDWNINVANKIVRVKQNTKVISSYDLRSYSGSFDIKFNNFGQPQSNPLLPYSITIEPETGFVQ